MQHYSMRLFQSDTDCLEMVFKRRYGLRFSCPDCRKKGKFSLITTRKRYDCQCGYGIYPLTGTIFQSSATPLKLWFYAIYIFATSPNGVAAKELERQLGVTYKTAWRISSQIRLVLSQQNTTRTEYDPNKLAVPAFENLMPLLFDTKHTKMKVASRKYLQPSLIDQIQSYINDQMQSTNLEKNWIELRRTLDETYRNISPQYLQTYIDEVIFRYANRLKPNDLFSLLLDQAITKTVSSSKLR
jgi:hypothetical protein